MAINRPWHEIYEHAQFVDTMAYALQVVDDDVPSTYKDVVRSSTVE